MKKISIIALGWLGSELYDSLLNDGHDVFGTYHERPKGKINESKYNFNDEVLPKEVLESDLIIFNLTPTTIKQIDKFDTFLKKVTSDIIFISSTSVYGQSGIFTEKDIAKPKTENGKLLLLCEELLIKRGKSLIIRPGGLYGGDRHPGKILAKKKNIIGANAPVNLTSRDDLIFLIKKCLTLPKQNIINAVNIQHPTKKEFYEKYSKVNSLSLPSFSEETDHLNKTVNTQFKEFVINSSLI